MEEKIEGNTMISIAEDMAEQTKSMLHLDEVMKYCTLENLVKIVISIVSILIFYIIYRVIKKLVKKQTETKFEKHTSVLISKIISYVFYVIIAMYILSLFGINLKAVWGAAGVAGLAIGFAAQTSVSNLISGIFVLTERAMKIGDYIEIDGVSGIVNNIGLLSVKINTLDNQMIRIPNSTIINANLTNYNHFKTRRFVFEIPIGYEANLEKAMKAIKEVPDLCPTVLKDPAPCVFFDGFGDAIILKLAVWFNSPDLIQTKNDVYMNIMKCCEKYAVEIPYNHYDITILDKDRNVGKRINM